MLWGGFGSRKWIRNKNSVWAEALGQKIPQNILGYARFGVGPVSSLKWKPWLKSRWTTSTVPLFFQAGEFYYSDSNNNCSSLQSSSINREGWGARSGSSKDLCTGTTTEKSRRWSWAVLAAVLSEDTLRGVRRGPHSGPSPWGDTGNLSLSLYC